MDYIQFTIGAERFSFEEAEKFFDWLFDDAFPSEQPAGGFRLVDGVLMITVTLVNNYGAAHGNFIADGVAYKLRQDGKRLLQLTGIRYTDDDILTYEVGDETQEPA